MKTKLTVALLVLVCGLVWSQIAATSSPPLKTNLPAAFYQATPPTGLLFSNQAPVISGIPTSRQQMPKPGVYLTKPYTCMVLVPGPQADDQMVKAPAVQFDMPTINPGLRFVPVPAGN